MNYPDADRKFPAVSLPVQATGQEYLHHVTVILPQTPDTLVAHPPGDEEGLCYIRREAFDQHACDEGRQDHLRVSVKHADTRREC